jgi:uncharacterized membrane protein
MSDATPQTPEGLPPRAPRWMKIALVVSLAINLAVIGLVAGADGGPQSGRIDGPNPFLRAMTPDDARMMRRLLRPDASQLGTSREMGRTAMEAILAQLRSDAFSEPDLRAAFEQISAANAARAGLGEEAIVTYLLSLNASERARFADRLEESVRRGGPRRGEGRPPRAPQGD